MSLLARIRNVFRPGPLAQDIDEELRFHVDMETARNERLGMSARAARRAALLAFGGVERHRESMREGRGVFWLEDAARDLRYGARTLLRNPGFTTAAVLTLALAIGLNGALFSGINAILLRPFPAYAPNRLVAVWGSMRARAVRSFWATTTTSSGSIAANCSKE